MDARKRKRRRTKTFRRIDKKKSNDQKYLLTLDLNPYLLLKQKKKKICRQRIPESSCMKEETFGIDTLITSKS